MKMKIIFISVFFPFLACGPARGPITKADDAGARASALVGGVSAESERDGSAWVSDVKMRNGAEVEVRFDAESGAFVSAEGETGPFDYDLRPVPGVLSFAEAVTAAHAVKAGNVFAWELKHKTDRYQWELYLQEDEAHLWEVKLVGDTGEITSAEQKSGVD